MQHQNHPKIVRRLRRAEGQEMRTCWSQSPNRFVAWVIAAPTGKRGGNLYSEALGLSFKEETNGYLHTGRVGWREAFCPVASGAGG
jgi:hypothetical protein